MSGRGKGKGKHGASGDSSAPTEEWLFDGVGGPTTYDPPLPHFPLEYKHDFDSATNPLRYYDTRKTTWPKCTHKKDCVVQMFDGPCDGGRRFFRCPFGDDISDQQNCGYTRWIDPVPCNPTVHYIAYLQNKIQDLQRDLDDALENTTRTQELVISIADDSNMCPDPFCRCPHHKPGPTNFPPPAAPHYGGSSGGYYDDVGYSQSGGQSNYSPWD